MKNYLKYIFILFLIIFSFYYTDKVIELSEHNNKILSLVNTYANENNRKCIEGFISKEGIVLSYNGRLVDENSSYNNMKGIGFKEELIEYKKDKCILNKEDNLDKYILSGNIINKNISIVIDVKDMKYYKDIEYLFGSEKATINYLISYENIDNFKNENSLLFKVNKNNIKDIKKKVGNFYCVKYNNNDVLDICKNEGISSINMKYYVRYNLLQNVKNILENGVIIFVEENKSNTYELLSTLKYIKSMGYNIVSIDELLS